jgi:FKBP-type peptidyl-prolyl cis-trans isomerase (trigger factor)
MEYAYTLYIHSLDKEPLMPDQPQTTPTDLPPIDTSKIKVDIIELEAPDFQLDFEVPVDLLSEISNRIALGGLDYKEQQMSSLIAQVCLDEGMQRLNRDSAWGARVLTKSMREYSIEKPFTFSAVVDTIPEGDVPIHDVPIRRNNIQVDDSYVDSELMEQQLLFGTKNKFDGELAYGDEIECNASITITDADEPVASIEKCTLRIPSEHQTFTIAGLQFESIGAELRDSQSAEELSFQIIFPDDHHVKALQGKSGTVKLTNCTFSRITPSTVEHVLEQYGTPNETILRTQIKMSLQHNFERENTNFMMRQFYTCLMENVNISISKRVVRSKFEEACAQELKRSGEKELSDEQKKMLMHQNEIQVKRMTINAWIQRTYKLGVSEEDIDKQTTILAEERRVRPADIKEEFLAKDKINILSNMAAERKIFERLQDKMVFTDI